MKRLIMLLVLIISFSSSHAQEMISSNVLRVGTSLVLFGCNNYKNKFELNLGSQIAVEYSRKISSIYSLDVAFFRQNYHGSRLLEFPEYSEPEFFKHYSTGVSVRNIFSPFNKARWLRFGIGAYAEYNVAYKSNDNELFFPIKGMYYGISLPIRFYLIDSKRFDLYAYYEFVAAIDYSNGGDGSNGKNIYQPYNLCGLMFGVKFW